jgi:3',5'-cyclic AMP phosphodiesterase CpdA
MRGGRSMRIAHLSDLHLLATENIPLRRFLNKRATGWVNLRLKRTAVHRSAYVDAIAREVARVGADHVIVTGDFTNLALENEFALARDLLRRSIGIGASHVTVVPGNHDLYTRGALTSGRFGHYFADWLRSDLPELAVDVAGARFPVVKLRGDVAIVALSSAVPRPPFVAAGELGAPQLGALQRVLAHPEVSGRTIVLALHHPVVHEWSTLKQRIEGLRDAPALLRLLRTLERGLVLHGHLHRRIERAITTAGGKLQHLGTTSASLHHDAPDKMAGFNLYDVDSRGEARTEARVYDPSSDSFVVGSVPKHP